MGGGDFVDVLRLKNLAHEFIPGHLNHLIGDVVAQHGHEVLHLMSAWKRCRVRRAASDGLPVLMQLG